MRPSIIIRHLGAVILLNALFLIISGVISLFAGEAVAAILLFSALLFIVLGLFPIMFVPRSSVLSFSEGMVVVVFGWVVTCLLGAIPYLLWGGEFTLANSIFESVSGFTTTGSSILTDVEVLPKGLLFWRSASHFIGGIGVVYFALLILPQSASSRVILFHTETSDYSRDNFRNNARQIVKVLGVVYLGLTLTETVLLWIAGMPLFDSLNHSFATIATGGFSVKNLSIGHYDSIAIEVIITLFMILSGIHFGLIFGTLTGKKHGIFNSSVARSYIVVLLGGIVLVTLKLWSDGVYDLPTSLRHASFQVASVGTTTGFATVDTESWPSFTKMILIYFIIQCAMVGSTSGGLKFDRIYLFMKSIRRQIVSIAHPKAILTIKVDGKTVTDQHERSTVIFILSYILLFFVVTLLLTAMKVDGMTAFSASITTIGNVGPGFGQVSSLSNFSMIPDAGKYLLSLNMLMGRLEIFNIIALVVLFRR